MPSARAVLASRNSLRLPIREKSPKGSNERSNNILDPWILVEPKAPDRQKPPSVVASDDK